MLPGLDTFLNSFSFKNSYIDHPEFESLYVRRGTIPARMGKEFYYCNNTITIANITSNNPGGGAFERLVASLILKGLAIYVECVHNERFANKLRKMGFTQVNEDSGNHFLINYAGHLVARKEFKWERKE